MFSGSTLAAVLSGMTYVVAMNAADPLADAATADAPVSVETASENAAPDMGLSTELVFADLSDEALIDRVTTYLGDLTTAAADFVQSSPSGAVQTGQFWLRRPRQLRMEYGPADNPPLLVVATQGNVYVRDNELETTDFYPVGKTPLRFLLTKDLNFDELEVVAVERGVDSVALTMRDQTGEAEGDLTLVLDAPTLALRQWVIRDTQNGLTVVSLENLVEGDKLNNRLFRIPDAGGQFINN